MKRNSEGKIMKRKKKNKNLKLIEAEVVVC